jgi:hypothetical protein
MLFIHNKLIRKHVTIALVLWSIIIMISVSWNIYMNIHKTSELAILEARALFNKDKAFRFWGASHGGVYVPQTEKTPPNPFLSHIPDRDIITTSGKKLTLMNPAYMVRQMMETYEEVYGVKGHITSIIHFRPETAPDEWEKKALKHFEKGEKEVVEFTTINNKPFLRLMQPLYVKKSCLKCHGFQGYKDGDLRGGVSLSLPINQHITAQKNSILGLILSHLLFWLIGTFTIILYGKKLSQKTDELIQHKEHLQETVDERTAELKEMNDKLKDTNVKLELFNETLVNREERIIEMKQEVNHLCTQLNKEVKYKEIDKQL